MVTMIFILKVEEEMIVPEKTLKKPRGVVDIGFFLVEEFETISEFDEFWKEHKFSKIYNHHMERACRIGSEDVFRCKYYSKYYQGGEWGLIKVKEQLDFKIHLR